MIELYESFVTSLYIDLLERTPDKNGHQYWVDALTSRSMTQEQVTQSFIESAEYRAGLSKSVPLSESFVTSLYIGLLDRTPDKDGHQYWIDALISGSMTQEQVAQSFLESNEYRDRSSDSLPLTETIQTLYSNAFDRPAEIQGIDYWVSSVTTQHSLANVVCQILAVRDDPVNSDGQRLSNAIDAVRHSMQISTNADINDGYRILGELDVVTSDKTSVALYNFLEETRLGAPATSSGAVKFDNVIKGDDHPGATLEGTNLNDLIILGSQTAVVYGLGGDDLFKGTDARNYFWPGNGNDTVEAGAGSDTIDARFDAPATLDKFYGQDGDDYIFGGAGNEFIDGGDGNDFIDAGAGNDVVRGGIGNDQIVKTGSGIFNILGEAGHDVIQVASSDSGVIDGGLGNDHIEVTGLTGGVVIYAMSGDDIVKLENVTRGSFVFLGDGNNEFTGTNINNIEITASSGNDWVTVRNGKYIIVDLGNGNNNIELIDCENVTVITGSGTDRFTVKNSNNITLKAGEGSDYFNVDAASFKTGSLKLDGGQFPFNSSYENWLTINGLAADDYLVFNKDNFSNFSDLAFDHSVRAKLVFESNTAIGKDYPPNSLYGSNSSEGYTLMEIHNINNADLDRLQSELWFMHGKKNFSSSPTDLGYITIGNWHAGTVSKSQYLTFNDGSEKTISFENITNNISNPYVFNGDLMLSWII